MKKSTCRSHFKVLDKEESSCFMPYLYNPRGMVKPSLFGKANEELEMLPRELLRKSTDLACHHGSNTSPCKVESESVTVYNLQRVLRQLGYILQDVRIREILPS